MPNFKVEKCSCGCSVRTGSLLIAYWETFQSLIFIIVPTFVLIHGDVKGVDVGTVATVPKPMLICLIVFATINLAFSFLLIVGIRQKQPRFLRIWIYFLILSITLFIIYQVFAGIMFLVAGLIPNGLLELLKAVSGTLISGYFGMIVNSHYWGLVEKQRNTGGSCRV